MDLTWFGRVLNRSADRYHFGALQVVPVGAVKLVGAYVKWDVPFGLACQLTPPPTSLVTERMKTRDCGFMII